MAYLFALVGGRGEGVVATHSVILCLLRPLAWTPGSSHWKNHCQLCKIVHNIQELMVLNLVVRSWERHRANHFLWWLTVMHWEDPSWTKVCDFMYDTITNCLWWRKWVSALTHHTRSVAYSTPFTSTVPIQRASFVFQFTYYFQLQLLQVNANHMQWLTDVKSNLPLTVNFPTTGTGGGITWATSACSLPTWDVWVAPDNLGLVA